MKNDRAEILLDDNDKVETPQHVKRKVELFYYFHLSMYSIYKDLNHH